MESGFASLGTHVTIIVAELPPKNKMEMEPFMPLEYAVIWSQNKKKCINTTERNVRYI
jgi:hypothetical protein